MSNITSNLWTLALNSRFLCFLCRLEEKGRATEEGMSEQKLVVQHTDMKVESGITGVGIFKWRWMCMGGRPVPGGED